jgi:hypothetical protein
MTFTTIHWALKKQVFIVKQFVHNADNNNDNDDNDDDLWRQDFKFIHVTYEK